MSGTLDYSNYKEAVISEDITKNLIDLRAVTGNTMDLNIMEINIGGVDCAVVTIESMVSTTSMAELIFRPLMEFKTSQKQPAQGIFDFCTKQSLLANERKILCTYGDIIQLLFSGFAVILINGIPRAIAYGIQGYDKKSISEPTSERNIMGSQEAFAEVIRTNISLIRRRIKNPALRFEMLQIGEKTSTDVCIVHMAGRAPQKIVDRVRKKLKAIKMDTVIASGYIKPFLEEKNSQNLFSGIGTTERPDILCSKLNEGKVGVLIDGTPFALICPSLFAENFKTIDDYCSKTYYAAFLRWIRYIAFFFAVAFPGIYVSVTNYHPEMFTLRLLLNLYASEQTTPYPLYFEVIIIMALLELMREASVRLPNAVSSAISIVGGLVIGDAAVKSGLISSPLLIIVGLTATASFVLPSFNQQTSILRILYIIAGGAAGFLGIAVCTILIISNICAMDEFYIPYTAPVSPFSRKEIMDVISRKSYRQMQKDHPTIEKYVGK